MKNVANLFGRSLKAPRREVYKSQMVPMSVLVRLTVGAGAFHRLRVVRVHGVFRVFAKAVLTFLHLYA